MTNTKIEIHRAMHYVDSKVLSDDNDTVVVLGTVCPSMEVLTNFKHITDRMGDSGTFNVVACKGIARVHAGDVYCGSTGIKVASRKAQLHAAQKMLKKYQKALVEVEKLQEVFKQSITLVKAKKEELIKTLKSI